MKLPGWKRAGYRDKSALTAAVAAIAEVEPIEEAGTKRK
jgi:hypothetical protein